MFTTSSKVDIKKLDSADKRRENEAQFNSIRLKV